MGMFDTFKVTRACPLDRIELREWQSKDGPCGLLTFQAGHPTAHYPAVMAEDPPLGEDRPIQPGLLPASFDLLARHGGRPEHYVVATGYADADGIWRRTDLVGVYTWRGSRKQWLWSAELADLREVAAAFELAMGDERLISIVGHEPAERSALLGGSAATTSRREHLRALRAFAECLERVGSAADWLRSGRDPAQHLALLRDTAAVDELVERIG